MRKEEKTNIVLTGGHAGTTAIAVVQELKSRKSFENFNIIWIGAKSSVEGKSTKPIEVSVLPKLGVKVEQITAGRLQRKFTFWTLPSLLKIPLGFLKAFIVLWKIRPKVILSFGGYVAYPVIVAGKILGIKSILHEQTVAAGRANIYSAKIVDKIALGRGESRKYFPEGKTIITGNPLMKNIENAKPKNIISVIPTIYVTLGSRGSLRINQVLGAALHRLLLEYKVIHLTGELDFDNFRELKDHLSPELQKNYFVYATVNPLEVHKYYSDADMVIGRSGANTVSEIIHMKIPSILIPLPFTYENEQYRNALFAEDYGIAKVLQEKDLNPENLLIYVSKLKKDWLQMKKNVKNKTSPDFAASKNLTNLISEYL